MKSILFEEMKQRNANFYDLQETDQWVNEATRSEINYILDHNKVFGVNQGDNGYHFVEPCKLRDSKNFSVKLLFKEDKREEITIIIQNYNCAKVEDFNMNMLAEFIKNLFDNSCYCCIWV